MSCSEPIRNDDVQKGVALLYETKISVGLVKEGIGYIQRKTLINNFFYYLPLFLLSQGFERLMKVIICIEEKERTGNFPTSNSNFFKGSEGHDLNALLEVIKNRCFTTDYVSSNPTITDDFNLINDDSDVKNIFNILSHFNKQGRYYYFDVVLDKEPFTGGPEYDWQRLEDIINSGDIQNISKKPNLSRIEISQHIAPLLKSLAKALGRLFTLGNLGGSEDTLNIPQSEFETIMKKDLGA